MNTHFVLIAIIQLRLMDVTVVLWLERKSTISRLWVEVNEWEMLNILKLCCSATWRTKKPAMGKTAKNICRIQIKKCTLRFWICMLHTTLGCYWSQFVYKKHLVSQGFDTIKELFLELHYFQRLQLRTMVSCILPICVVTVFYLKTENDKHYLGIK